MWFRRCDVSKAHDVPGTEGDGARFSTVLLKEARKKPPGVSRRARRLFRMETQAVAAEFSSIW